MIYKRGFVVWLVLTVILSGVSIAISVLYLRGATLRGIAADNILLRADAHALLQFMAATENLRGLIKFGMFFGYLGVTLILAALFIASIRWEQ